LISFWRNFDKNNIGFFGWEWYNSINRVWYNSINPLLSALHKSDFDKNWISVIVDVDEAFYCSINLPIISAIFLINKLYAQFIKLFLLITRININIFFILKLKLFLN
jgi:hypothetical protein